MLEISCTFRFQNDIFSMTLSLLLKKMDRKAKEIGMEWGKGGGGGSGGN